MRLFVLIMLVECVRGDVSHVVNKYLPPDVKSFQSQSVGSVPQSAYTFQGSNGNAIQGFSSTRQFDSAPQTVFTTNSFQKSYTPAITQQVYRQPLTQVTFGRPDVQRKSASVYTTQNTYTPISNTFAGPVSTTTYKTYATPAFQNTYTGPSVQNQYSTYRQPSYNVVTQKSVSTFQKPYTPVRSQQSKTAPVIQKSYVAPATTFQAPYASPAIQKTIIAPQKTNTFVTQSASYTAPVSNIQKSYVPPVRQTTYTGQTQQSFRNTPSSFVRTNYVKPIQKPYTAPITTTAYTAPVIQKSFTAPQVQQTYYTAATTGTTFAGTAGTALGTYKAPSVQTYTAPLSVASTQYSLPQIKSDFNLNTRYDKNGGYVY